MKKAAFVLLIIIAYSVFSGIYLQDNHVYASSKVNDSTILASPYIKDLRDDGVSLSAFFYAYEGYTRLKENNLLNNDTLLTLIDFEKPSNEERLYIIDIKNKTVVRKLLVAHGKNSGKIYANTFSNQLYSNMSSLGLFVTSNTYQGKHGYSLRINGMDDNLNSNVRKRGVVIHGANYVSKRYIKVNGRLGRSFGCPAIPEGVSAEIIDLIKNGSCLFIYHPSINATAQYHN